MYPLFEEQHFRAALTLLAGLAVVVLFSVPSYSADEQPHGITATGHGEVMAQPDIARVMVSVVTNGRTQSQASAENARTMTAVRDALMSKAGIAQKDIETFGFNVQPQYDYKPQPPRLVGYQVTNTVRVTIRDLNRVGEVIDTATEAGANQVQGLAFEIENDKALQNRALVEALNDARGQAELIAKTLGVPLGRPISVTQTTTIPRPIPFFAARAEMAGAPPPETPVQPRVITVVSDVTVVYAIP